MKHTVRRIVISAVLFALISGIVVLIIGLKVGWKTPAQFSDGFFWAGALMISIGLLSFIGALSERTVSGLQYSQSAVHLDSAERFKIWAADIARTYSLMAFLGIAGVLLFGMSGLAILVGRRF